MASMRAPVGGLVTRGDGYENRHALRKDPIAPKSLELPDHSWDASSLFLSVPHLRRNRWLVSVGVRACLPT